MGKDDDPVRNLDKCMKKLMEAQRNLVYAQQGLGKDEFPGRWVEYLSDLVDDLRAVREWAAREYEKRGGVWKDRRQTEDV